MLLDVHLRIIIIIKKGHNRLVWIEQINTQDRDVHLLLGLRELKCPTRCLCAHSSCPGLEFPWVGMPQVIFYVWINFSSAPFLLRRHTRNSQWLGICSLPSGSCLESISCSVNKGWIWGCSSLTPCLGCHRPGPHTGPHPRPHRHRAGPAGRGRDLAPTTRSP